MTSEEQSMADEVLEKKRMLWIRAARTRDVAETSESDEERQSILIWILQEATAWTCDGISADCRRVALQTWHGTSSAVAPRKVIALH